MDKAGYVDGRHVTAHVDTVRELLEQEKLAEAQTLLERLIDATEQESVAHGFCVAPWYYEQAALAYRNTGNTERERAVLQRFSEKPYPPGKVANTLLSRLSELGGGSG
jgi:hypothetical protein